MKKVLISLAMSSLLFASCADGFLRGGDPGAIQVGSIIGATVGSVIGNNMNHWNGYALGAMVGSVTGAVVANEATKPHNDQYIENDYANNSQPIVNQDNTIGQNTIACQNQNINQYPNTNQSINTNQDNKGVASDYRDRVSDTNLDVRNIRFVDQNRNKIINKGETCHLIFDVYNSGNVTAYAVRPVVTIVDGEKDLAISVPPMVKMLMQGEVVMYDVVLRAPKTIHNTFTTFRIEVHDRNGYSNNYRQFSIDASNEN